jgi:enediyne biosynthesis protein E4
LNNDLKIDLMQLDMLPEDNKRQKEMLGSQDFDKKQMSISSKFDYQLQYMRNSLQINQGNQANQPIFSEIGLLAGVAKTDWSWATLLSDLDNDGRKDIFITNGYRKNVTDKDFIQFNESENMFGTDQAKAVNREQLLTKVPEIKLRNYAYQNDAELGFKDVSESWGLDELSFANGAIYADLDLDGDLDLVVNNIDQEASIFKNKSNEKPNQNYLKIKFKGTENNKKGIGTKVFVYANGTQQVAENYPIRGFQSSVEQGIMFGLGKNQQADSIKVLWKNGLIETKYQVKSNQNLVFNIISAKKGILNKIENDPLFEDISESLQFNSIESDYVDFKQTPALHKMLSRHSNAIGIGDLNGDNLEDIVIGGTYLGNQTTIFIQQKDGKYLPKPLFQNQSNNNLNGQEIGDILIFDANGDNKNDILLVGGSNERPLTVKEAYQPILMLNESKGSFNPTNDFPNIQLSSQVIRAFDFDNDLDLDIFIGGRQIPNQYPYSPKSYFLMNEKGKFIDKTNEIASNISNLGMICDAQSIDFDNDNDQDLIVVGEWMPITLIENKNKKFEIKQQLKNSEGWWNCIKLADFDNDGDDDVLLGNEGLNSFYQANENEPVQVFAKDFNEDGQIDPIMGHYVKNQNVPVLPRETLIQQVIQFKKKYPFFAEYAKADFDDLFSDLNLDNCLKLKATELKSCYLENKGKGNFEMKPLPKLAQSSPIFSFIVDDFDGDKHLDALAIGNFYANEANMGRQDASSGIILKGDGKGNFKAENSISKGIDLRGDLRRSVFDKKSKKGFIMNCGGALKVFGVKKST